MGSAVTRGIVSTYVCRSSLPLTTMQKKRGLGLVMININLIKRTLKMSCETQRYARGTIIAELARITLPLPRHHGAVISSHHGRDLDFPMVQ